MGARLSRTCTSELPNGLTIEAGDSEIRGLVIINFSANGILIRNKGGNEIKGNFIGIDGVQILQSPNNTIGGTTPEKRNVISGNRRHDVRISENAAKENTVQGNYIGTNKNGNCALDAQRKCPLGNEELGVGVFVAPNNHIGGTAGTTPGGPCTGACNVISGNGFDNEILDGVAIGGNGAEENTVKGNFIGTDVTGQFRLGNFGDGVRLAPSFKGGAIFLSTINNTIGGTEPGAGNLISGNLRDGVRLENRATLNFVLGNFIGTDTSGKKALPNEGDGVRINNTANNTIGGTDAKAGNVISGNAGSGVAIHGSGATGNTVLGNRIGTTADGTGRLANELNGVAIFGSPNNTIGGADHGDAVCNRACNLISGNKENGVFIGIDVLGVAATSTSILGNFIGTNIDGSKSDPDGIPSNDDDLGNVMNGVLIQDSPDNFVGGPLVGEGNVISGNVKGSGVLISGIEASGNFVLGNTIGLGSLGVDPAPNGNDGVHIENAPDNFIGGASELAQNVISTNEGEGVRIKGMDATGNKVRGNAIGTNFDGTVALGNVQNGVLIDGAHGNFIGGGQTGEGNVISANKGSGVLIFGFDATDNRVQGNAIGTNFGGALDLGNKVYGVVVNSGKDNLIGGPNKDDGNKIAFNGSSLGRRGHGVVITSVPELSATGNAIHRNSIYKNKGRGIDLNPKPGNPFGDGFTLNDRVFDIADIDKTVSDGDTGPNLMQNYPVVTRVAFGPVFKGITWTLNSAPDTEFIIEFYANSEPDPSGFGEGERFLTTKTVTTDDQGAVTITEAFDKTNDLFILAIAIDPDGNTSEFSMVDTDGDALADMWEGVGDGVGIDVDEDGKEDFLLVDADPLHKDIYVEVDVMLRGPSDASAGAPYVTQAILDTVRFGRGLAGVPEGFENVPNDLVQNLMALMASTCT